jgi:ATPase subunit of ABC transporter with duplicated ATPase domains
MKARENPFKTDSVLGVRYRLRDRTWEELFERLKKLNYRAAIIGPHGTGKTTLLEEMEPRLAARGFRVIHLRLDRETRSFEQGFLRRLFTILGERDVILFDGAEQMSRLGWQLFKIRSKRAAGLVITSHRRGMLPTLMECATSSELLREIIRELLGGEARCEMTDKLHTKHGGNLRDALREMYDLYAAEDFKFGTEQW